MNLFLTLAVSAKSWYWPFGYDEDSTNAPPRLHRLLEKANDYIELAEDETLNGNSDKALENYRLALMELDRVEAENPDRAEKSEFAPLRNRRAVCTAAIDAIRFAQVNENERSVAVSDTTELQKKWNRKHGIPDSDDRKREEEESPKKTMPGKVEADRPAETGTSDMAARAPVTAVETNSPLPQVGREPEPDGNDPEAVEDRRAKGVEELVAANRVKNEPLPSDWAGRLRTAFSQIQSRDYAVADVLLESLLKERPNDLNALLLRAAAQSGTGNNYAARRTLEKAMRAHPRSYLPYYNLAQLTLTLGEGVESARQYYEMGRMVGGPVNAALEARLKEAK